MTPYAFLLRLGTEMLRFQSSRTNDGFPQIAVITAPLRPIRLPFKVSQRPAACRFACPLFADLRSLFAAPVGC